MKSEYLTIAFVSAVVAILIVVCLVQLDKWRMLPPGPIERIISATETIAEEEQKQTELMR